jgi:small subunit ribosomal protein S13
MAEQEFKYLVRVANTDVDGNKQILFALQKIKGVSSMFANAICKIAGVPTNAKAGYLVDADVEKLDAALKNIEAYPKWLLNRKKDFDTGKDTHLILSELTFTNDNDVKRLKMVKSYRGMRHQWGLPLRGQRTKSNFRKTKMAASRNKKRK